MQFSDMLWSTAIVVLCKLQIPIEIMNQMAEVPVYFLKQLAEDKEVFVELPPKVKQQVRHYASTVQTNSVPFPFHTYDKDPLNSLHAKVMSSFLNAVFCRCCYEPLDLMVMYIT